MFLFLFLSICLFSGQSSGVVLSLNPATQEVVLGNTTTVNLNISGLGEFSPISLGAFLTEITFDDTILSFESASYGPFLGDSNDFFETDIITTANSGSVSLDEFSFLFDFELDIFQPDSFTLATLSFSGEKIGTSSLDFGLIDLSDAIGFSINPILVGAAVNVKSASTEVSEPFSFILLLTGFTIISFVKIQTKP